MKTFWKLLGAAALAVGLTPYHVEKDEETGEKKYQALLWQATKTSQTDMDIKIGLYLPKAAEEPHLFSDELCVEYTGVPVSEEETSEVPAEAAASPEHAEPSEEEVAEAAEEAPAEEEDKEEA